MSDVPALYEIFSDPEVMRYWSSPPFTEIARIERMVNEAQPAWDTEDFVEVGVELISTGIVIGRCTIFNFNRQSRRAEVGYILGRAHWGKGLMAEALRSLLGYAFESLELNRIEADIDPRNVASARLLEKLGFKREGYLRERWIVADEVSDSAIYGLIKSDWAGA